MSGMEMPPKERRILPPVGGWEENAWYLVNVSYNPNNPIHESLFYTGFLNGPESGPGGYNSVVPITGTAGHSHTTINDIHYLQAVRELYRQHKDLNG